MPLIAIDIVALSLCSIAGPISATFFTIIIAPQMLTPEINIVLSTLSIVIGGRLLTSTLVVVVGVGVVVDVKNIPLTVVTNFAAI